MILREFLYLDVDKVRGLAAQVYEGVVEKSTESQADSKEGGLAAGPVKWGRQWGSTAVLEKSMADALFPTLEDDLESNGLLKDVSEELADEGTWDDIETIAPAGAIIRMSGPAAMFDARYFASAFSSMIVTGQGVDAMMGIGGEGTATAARGVPPKAKTAAQKKAERDQRRQEEASAALLPGSLESEIPEGPLPSQMRDDFTRDQFVGMVKIARGVFTPGLHFTMYGAGTAGPAISARLEEGRQFLDSVPEVLFQRYGVEPLEWTLVGIVGHHGAKGVKTEFPNILNPDGESVSRGRTAASFNQLTAHFAHLGFADLPTFPGFSVIPLAVYRVLPGSHLGGGAVPSA